MAGAEVVKRLICRGRVTGAAGMLELCSARRTPRDWGSSQVGAAQRCAGARNWRLLFLAPEHILNIIKWSPPFPLPPLSVSPSLPCSPVLQLSLTTGKGRWISCQVLGCGGQICRVSVWDLSSCSEGTQCLFASSLLKGRLCPILLWAFPSSSPNILNF